MSKYRVFTEESRQQILNSLTNNSSSKQAWSFSREKRFIKPPANCPQVAYMTNTSTLSNRKPGFGSSRRKVFTQVSQGPSSWIYNPVVTKRVSAKSIAQGRSEIVANCYIPSDPLKNPGPGNYAQPGQVKKGYSMRPKTANNRNYFINDQQQAQVPGPGNYEDNSSRIVGKNLISKFKSAVLGGSTMLNKSDRFSQFKTKTPSVWEYKIKQRQSSKGGKIGTQFRPSFTQKAASSSFTPGPGNYKIPSQFGHYRKIKPFI